MFTVIGVIAVTLFFGWLFLIGVYGLIGYVSDYPAPFIRFFGLLMMVASAGLWYMLVGIHITIGIA